MIRLLALDMDGTLFNTQKEVSLENQKALAAARDLGVKVVITTGRPLKAIQSTLESLGLYDEDNYSITFNGGLVQRNNGEVLAKRDMTFEEVSTIAAEMARLALPIDVISDGTVYSLPSQGNQSLYQTANPMLAFVTLASLEELPRDIVYNKVVVVFNPEFLDQQIPHIRPELYEQFELFKSRDIILEVMPKGVHKAVGLAGLAQYLGIDRCEVMAMGDEANDLTMLEWAGLGVAMANATPDVKAIADAVTTRTNDASGVAEAIDTYILNRN